MSDCATLLAIKDTLAGTIGNLNWSADVGISSWDGVTIENNRVTRLELDEHRLNGTIPPELDNLDNLELLDLIGNQLTDAIPPELANLDNLYHLVLSRNQLTGAIPPELGNLDNLTELSLSFNRLTGCIPTSLRAPLGDENEIYLIGLPFCQIGTRNNPIPLGAQVITHDGFSLWVEEVIEDATQIVSDARPDFNVHPVPGNQYVLVRITVKNNSYETRSFNASHRLHVVGNSSVEYSESWDLLAPDYFSNTRNMFEGGELSGNIIFSVKPSDANSLVMYDADGSDWIFFALH